MSRVNISSAGCQICSTLSSATDAIVNSDVGCHAKSDILLVCPPCTKSSSGGPSSASSGDCSSPILCSAHMFNRRSAPQDARIVGLSGAHPICKHHGTAESSCRAVRIPNIPVCRDISIILLIKYLYSWRSAMMLYEMLKTPVQQLT